jgi:hypothetical protein
VADASTEKKVHTNTPEVGCTAVSKRIKTVIETIFHLFWPIIATILFAIVTPILVRGASVGSPLSKLSPPMGTFLLSVFSKLTDFVLD